MKHVKSWLGRSLAATLAVPLTVNGAAIAKAEQPSPPQLPHNSVVIDEAVAAGILADARKMKLSSFDRQPVLVDGVRYLEYTLLDGRKLALPDPDCAATGGTACVVAGIAAAVISTYISDRGVCPNNQRLVSYHGWNGRIQGAECR